MNNTRKSLYDRCIEKTPEQVFINSLRREYELSPAESKGILELAKDCLFGRVPQLLGKQRYLCASRRARHGKRLSDQEMIRVEITIDNGIEDLDVLRSQGVKALRQLKIMRITEEAYIQGGLLTQEDLGRLLQVSSRTIRKDTHQVQQDGNTIHTRGYDHDIGRRISHKARIIDLYLSGFTYDEIMRKTRHSAFSIKRYVSSFGRLLLLLSHDMKDISEMSRLLHQSERLTREYLRIYSKYLRGDHWPTIYTELLDQLKALYPAKKKACQELGGVYKA